MRRRIQARDLTSQRSLAATLLEARRSVSRDRSAGQRSKERRSGRLSSTWPYFRKVELLSAPAPAPEYLRPIPFAHEQLDVYRLALDFLVAADAMIEAFPGGRSHLADQLTRASTSIVLNLAEGAGKFSKPDKRRYYLTAIGSTTECAAILDVGVRLGLVGPEIHAENKAVLERVAAMLLKLAKSQEQR